MSPSRLSCKFLAFILALCWTLLTVCAATNEPALDSLQLNKPIERSLRQDEAHSYTLTLDANQYAYLVVDQRDVDVVVAIYGPDGAKIVQVDSPNYNRGPEHLSFVAGTAGMHRLEVRSGDIATGRYEVCLTQLRTATREDQSRFVAQKTWEEAKTLRNKRKAESYYQAIEKYQEAVKLWRVLNEELRLAFALHEVGWIYGDIGQYQKALDSYAEASALYRKLGCRKGEANILSLTAYVFGSLGDHQKSLEMYLHVDEINHAIGFVEPVTLSNIGTAYSKVGQFQRALDYHFRVLEMRRSSNDRAGQAITLSNIGACYYSLGEKRKALSYYNEALTLMPVVKDDHYTATTLNHVGALYRTLGGYQEALSYFDRALRLRRAVGDQSGVAATLSHIARLEGQRGNLVEARMLIEEALKRAENLRGKVANPRLRATYFASVQEYREFYLALLMRMHKISPSEGFDRAAFNASETGRARSLLESLKEASTEIRHGVDQSLLNRERDLGQSIADSAKAQMRLLSREHAAAEAAAVAKQIDELTNEYEQVQAQIREMSPRYAELVQPVPLELDEIQKRVLDPDTLLLEYSIGERKSYVWAVTPDSIRMYELPKRSALEPLARRVYDLLIERNQNVPQETLEQRRARLDLTKTQYTEAAANLSRIVLGPVASQLGNKRLLIVSDGMLQFIPFAALPDPAVTESRPLIVDHEIVTAPSASVIALLRHENGNRKPAAKTLAVLADPVFSNDDPRVATARSRSTNNTVSAHAVRAVTEGDLRRLRFSRQEADEIARLAAAGSKLEAVDFDANRKLATSAELGQYRIVHFATHGLIDNQYPELSGVVLSLVDEKGQPQNGFLRLYDLYNLKLSAELVVLSACQTALGKEIKGEGLVGLTRGFMYAGAPRVIASLWQIDDRASAEFMKRFYQELLGKNVRPAAALRAAQVSMQNDKRWNAPHYWAAFTLQGEWR
jgi:CHAT domain-containing protein